MPISALAPELLRHILGYLGEGDLEAGSLVCRDWLVPCREIYWGRITLFIPGEIPESLLHVIRDGKTNIPRHLGGLIIDERECMGDRDPEEAAEWWGELSTVTNHFTSISKVNLEFFNFGEVPDSSREEILRPGVVTSELTIQHLEAERLSDLTFFAFQNPRLKVLVLGSINFSSDNIDAADIQRALTKPARLNSLNLLSIHGNAEGTWAGVVPCLMQLPILENLKTIVVTCHDDRIVSRLLGKARSSLLSLALKFEDEDNAVPNLSQVGLLRNLSIDLSGYPSKAWLLPNLVQAVSSLTKLERIFINCGPSMMKAEKQIDDHLALWEELDVRISQLPGLQHATFIMVLDSCMGMFLDGGVRGGVSNVIESWKSELLEYVQAKLPSCRESGLVEVVQVTGSWTGNPFPTIITPA